MRGKTGYCGLLKKRWPIQNKRGGGKDVAKRVEGKVTENAFNPGKSRYVLLKKITQGGCEAPSRK